MNRYCYCNNIIRNVHPAYNHSFVSVVCRYVSPDLKFQGKLYLHCVYIDDKQDFRPLIITNCIKMINIGIRLTFEKKVSKYRIFHDYNSFAISRALC